jgi:hypothetical protein
MNLGDYVSIRACQVARRTLDGIRSGELQTMGDIDNHVSRELGAVTDDLMSIASGASSPMIQSMVASMKPAILEVLQEYTPTFAAVSGGMLAIAVLLGVWIAKPDTFERWFR